MHVHINNITKRTKPNPKTLLHTIPYYSINQLTTQFWTHIFPILEQATGAIYYVSITYLRQHYQPFYSFLSAINITPKDTFLTHNLPPLNLRRVIALLGLLSRVALITAHPHFQNSFSHVCSPACVCACTRACVYACMCVYVRA